MFKEVARITVMPGEINTQAAVIDTINGYAYYGTGSTPGKIIKIRLSDFTRVGDITLLAGEGPLLAAVIDENAGFAYFGTFTTPAKIIKIDLATFTRVADVTLPLLDFPGLPFITTIRNGIGYFCSDSQPCPECTIVGVQLSDLTVVGSVTMPDSGAIHSVVRYDNFGFFGTMACPANTAPWIFKVDLDTLTVVESMQFQPPGFNPDFPAAAILNASCGGCPAGQIEKFGYFSYTPNTPPQPDTIIKLDLESFEIVQMLTLPFGITTMVTAIGDPGTGYTYFGAYGTPAQVIRVLTFDMTYQNKLPLIGTADASWASMLRDNNGFIYIATLSGEIIKINVSTVDSIPSGTGCVFQIDLSQKVSNPNPASWNLDFTKLSWLPDLIRTNYEHLHGYTFTEYGEKAKYLKDNYTTGPDRVLKVIAEL
jgi:hypothetical protein